MNLQNTLNSMKEASEAGMEPEVKAVMHKATNDLANSGIIERVLQPGAKIPHFSLPDEQEIIIKSQDLLQKGPLVVSFYRGVW